MGLLRERSLRLVRRKPPWGSVEVDEDFASDEVIPFLNRLDQRDPLKYSCALDSMENLPYRDSHYVARPDMTHEEAFFREIFVVNNQGKARRLAKYVKKSEVPLSSVLRALSDSVEQYRFHFDKEFIEKSDDLHGLLSKLGYC